MRPLIAKLPAGDWDAGDCGHGLELMGIEFIAARLGFVEHCGEVVVDGVQWRCMFPKSRQLRMRLVPSGLSGKHSLGQKSLPPQGHQALGIEVLGMNGPQAHGSSALFDGDGVRGAWIFVVRQAIHAQVALVSPACPSGHGGRAARQQSLQFCDHCGARPFRKVVSSCLT